MSTVSNFYGIGADKLYSMTMMDLFCNIAAVPFEDLCDRFRVDTSRFWRSVRMHHDYYNYDGIIGYTIAISFTESDYKADYIDSLIEQYRSDLIEYVEKMSDEKFAGNEASVYSTRTNYDLSFMYWNEIIMQEYDFGCFDATVKYLAAITKSEFIEFVRAHCLQEQYKLSIQFGRDPLAPCDDRLSIISTPISLIDSTTERFLHDLQAFKDGIFNQIH